MGVVYSTGLSRGLLLDRNLLGRPLPWVVENRGIEYPGEVILAEAVDPRWGEPLSGGLRFRVVFYTVPRRIPAGHIKDRRIVMAVPRAADPDRESLGHELQSIREARPHYVPSHDPGASAVRGPRFVGGRGGRHARVQPSLQLGRNPAHTLRSFQTATG